MTMIATVIAKIKNKTAMRIMKPIMIVWFEESEDELVSEVELVLLDEFGSGVSSGWSVSD